MEVSYKHDVGHSFLVIQPEGEVDTGAYTLRMILGNPIPGLLPCRLQKADGKVLFYYDITSKQQISEAYPQLGYEGLKNVYQGFLKVFGKMETYLLDFDQILLEPEYVYFDKKGGEIYLCYLPGHAKPIQEQLRCFTEYLLPRMEHKDQKGVMLGYGIYRILVEEGFQMENVREMLHRPGLQEEGELNIPGEGREDPEVFPEALETGMDGLETGEEASAGKGSWIKTWGTDIVLMLAGMLLLGGLVAARQMGYFANVSLPMMLAAVLGLILAAALVVWAGGRKDSQKIPKEASRGVPMEVPKEVPRDTRGTGAENMAMPLPWEEMEKGKEPTAREGAGEGADIGEETVILYRSPEYGCPVLICEEAGQAPPIVLNRDIIVVGKIDGVSDVLLDRPPISRLHAKIQKKGQEYWIADLNSKNGTFVNGKKLEKEEEYLLQPADQVVFADISYRFEKSSG